MDFSQVLSSLKSKDVVLYLHCLFSVLCVVGASIWTASDDVYTLTGSYTFYWFLTILTLFVSVLGLLYYKFPNVWEHITYQMELDLTANQKCYSIFCISIVFNMLWLVSAACVVDVLNQCQYFKKYWELTLPDRLSNSTDNYNYKCDGEIVSTTFAFSMFATWSFITFTLGKKLYRKLREPSVIDVSNPDTIHQSI